MNNEMLSTQAVVKWFNPFKGYGFVNVKGIAEDVFLHFSSLHQHEINVVKPGDILMCDISFSNEKRYYVACVKSYQSTANNMEKAEHCVATVKWFTHSKAMDSQWMNMEMTLSYMPLS